MNFDKYTNKVKQIIQVAQALAVAKNNQFITSFHFNNFTYFKQIKKLIAQSF